MPAGDRGCKGSTKASRGPVPEPDDAATGLGIAGSIVTFQGLGDGQAEEAPAATGNNPFERLPRGAD